MKKKVIIRISALVSGISGLVILAGVIIPVFFYKGDSTKLLSPTNDSLNPTTTKTEVDYSRASNWFPEDASKRDFNVSNIGYYTISIPKLKIEKATVAIGGDDLAKHIIQYPGTALPGKRGNAVLFGHSVLPMFFNPKEYMTIFSTLPTIKEGDEIYINYDGIDFTYRVETKFEVWPQDIQVLEQDTKDSFLTLVTCVPPGDPRKPKRLIVRARIVQL